MEVHTCDNIDPTKKREELLIDGKVCITNYSHRVFDRDVFDVLEQLERVGAIKLAYTGQEGF